MNQATEVYSREFDSIFFELPPHIRERIELESVVWAGNWISFRMSGFKGILNSEFGRAITGFCMNSTSARMSYIS